MTRSGYLVAGALVFALAAAGVLVWTNFLDLSGENGFFPRAAAPSAPPSREAQLVKRMTEAVAEGGIAVSFVESDVRKWKVADGDRLEKFTLDSSGPVFARLTSSAALDKASIQWPSLGLSVGLPLEFTKLSNGRKIEVGFVARSAATNGSPAVSVVYATQQAGNSGWKSVNLQPQFEAYKFEYAVPSVPGGYTNPPVIVFHSDPSGSGRAVELIGLYVRPVP